MRSIPSIVALALGIGFAAPAHAVTLSSGLLSAGGGAGGGTLLCTVSNLDKKPVTVTMTIVGPNGDAIEDGDSCAENFNGQLPPGASCIGAIGGANTARCTVVSSSNKVRAVFAVRDSAFNFTAVLPLTK